MTAEIAILNKSAAALAADSAMTISNGANIKIYKTVNKIFELSDTQPIALMVYGSLEYMGLPFETVAKLYRRDNGNSRTFSTVENCAYDLIEYLEKNVPCSGEDKRRNVLRLIYLYLRGMASQVEVAIWADITARGKFYKSKLNTIAQSVIKDRISELQLENPGEPFRPGNLAGIISGYEALIDPIINELLSNILQLTDATRRELVRLVKYELHRAPLSPGHTGVVVCGFGADEICPSLAHFEVDGMVRGKLKRRWVETIDIGRENVGADVRAFAQGEMVGRFLMGIDPAYEQYLNEITTKTFKDLSSKILRAVSKHAGISIPRNTLNPVVEQLTHDFHKKTKERREREYKKSILNMVEFMPIEELATFARSLVDLTSLKRRVSAEQETVGGEIDVAIISKSEGLVWISRKHYFPAELNPRFYQRHYNFSGDEA